MPSLHNRSRANAFALSIGVAFDSSGVSDASSRRNRCSRFGAAATGSATSGSAGLGSAGFGFSALCAWAITVSTANIEDVLALGRRQRIDGRDYQ